MAKQGGVRVSVVIPVRDGSTFVRSAVESVLAQSESSCEVVVVENGSQDDTAAVVRRIARDDNRVRLLTMEPRGVSAARNLGIGDARGEWIGFLDADDRWAPEKIERQLADADGDLRFSDSWLVDETGTTSGCHHEFSPPPPQRLGTAETLLVHLIRYDNCVPLSTVLVSRRALRRVGGFSRGLTHAEDWHLWLRLLLAGTSWSRVEQPLAYYQVTAGAASRDLPAMVRGQQLALQDLRPALSAKGMESIVRARERALERSGIVLSRASSMPRWRRGRDLGRLVLLRASWRSVSAQLVYTVAPDPAMRFVGAERHDLRRRLKPRSDRTARAENE